MVNQMVNLTKIVEDRKRLYLQRVCYMIVADYIQIMKNMLLSCLRT